MVKLLLRQLAVRMDNRATGSSHSLSKAATPVLRSSNLMATVDNSNRAMGVSPRGATTAAATAATSPVDMEVSLQVYRGI